MKIKLFIFLIVFVSSHYLQAQTLFTYGKYAVSKSEFLKAFNKNPDTTKSRVEQIKEYLDLYINFRLKLQAAYDEKVNENADLKAEAETFKTQLTDNFINQQANLNQLIHEAFVRSQKDILLQQVFVQFGKGSDTTETYTQILKAFNELKAGKTFNEVAAIYSTDSSSKADNGKIGYITVFTLPYSIENIVYNLKPGEFSSIYISNNGYHIFKNAGERPAVGRKKIEQLLFPTPSFYADQQIIAAKHLADSVYNLLRSGTSFASLLPMYGHHYYDYQPANEIEVKVGDYDNDFEQQVFNLQKVGDISKPFKTKYGYNILKLNDNLPVAKNENDVSFNAFLQTQIQNDGRLDIAKNDLIEKWLPLTGFKTTNFNRADLWIYTDSILKNNKNFPASYKQIKPKTVLFQFTKKNITVKDWIDYLRSNKSILDRQNNYQQQMHNYIRYECNKYYRQHIEDFDTAAAEQIKEFNDANMLFYMMDKHVWSKASNDSEELRRYYEAHKNAYKWKQSATALVISAPDKTLADSIAYKIKADPLNWRNIISEFGSTTIYADSNRFEINQLPVKQKILMQKDFQTDPEVSDAADSYVFIHILQLYSEPEPKSFEEAKGEVVNDYQQELELQWINDLKKIYPVRINSIVYKTLH